MSSIGIKLPLTYNSADGFTMIKTIRQMIKQNFKMLILTNPGERVMEPQFGVGLSQYLFANYSEGIPSIIEERIRKQASMYLPVVSVDSIDFQSFPDTNSLKIIIKYIIPSIGINDLLEITI
tara:strand:- start:5774 stop:6139 length:366 start_codon:yes stop_codon:yes gene_type:complete